MVAMMASQEEDVRDLMAQLKKYWFPHELEDPTSPNLKMCLFIVMYFHFWKVNPLLLLEERMVLWTGDEDDEDEPEVQYIYPDDQV